MDVADASVDTKLSTLKPFHAKSYQYFKSEEGRKNILSGWRGSGIRQAVTQSRDTSWQSMLNPFAALSLN